MCSGSRKKDKKTQTGTRKKVGCMRRLRRWCCRKAKRRIMRQVFGVPDTILPDNIVGLNLSSIRNKMEELEKLTSNKIQVSNLNEKDIKMLQKMTEKKLKKKFQISDSNHKILVNMLKDYDEENLLLTDVAQKYKKLDKLRLNQILLQYDEAKRKKEQADSKKNAKGIKAILGLTATQRKTLDKIIGDIQNMIAPNIDLAKLRFDSTVTNKSEIKRILSNYQAVEKGKRDLLSVLNTPNFEDAVSKSRILSLLQSIEKLRLSELLQNK